MKPAPRAGTIASNATVLSSEAQAHEVWRDLQVSATTLLEPRARHFSEVSAQLAFLEASALSYLETKRLQQKLALFSETDVL